MKKCSIKQGFVRVPLLTSLRISRLFSLRNLLHSASRVSPNSARPRGESVPLSGPVILQRCSAGYAKPSGDSLRVVILARTLLARQPIAQSFAPLDLRLQEFSDPSDVVARLNALSADLLLTRRFSFEEAHQASALRVAGVVQIADETS